MRAIGYVHESLDTNSAAGRLILNIMTAVSQWEREAIGGTDTGHAGEGRATLTGSVRMSVHG